MRPKRIGCIILELGPLVWSGQGVGIGQLVAFVWIG